jgi:predicted DNA-binding ribbon-helix-helix protein
MMKGMKFQLDEFGRDALDEFVRGANGSRSAAVRTACLYYLADHESGRAAWPAPSQEAASSGASAVAVRLDRETWRGLQEEAERQDVSASDLTRHAVLYFLADVDSGRVGQRLESALTDGDQDE